MKLRRQSAVIHQCRRATTAVAGWMERKSQAEPLTFAIET